MPGLGYTLPDVTVTKEAETERGSGGTNDWHGRASIVRRSDGALVMTYYRSTGHAANAGPGLSIRFSDDEGATWTSENQKLGGGAVPGFPMNPTGAAGDQDAGEPWMIVAPSGDILLFMWRVDYNVDNDGTQMARSSDGGETWTTPAAVTVTGASNQTLVYMTDDDFVLDGVIYAGYREYTTGTYTACSFNLAKSEDDGETWTKVGEIMGNAEGGNGSIEGGVEYLGDSTIIAMLRDTDHVASYRAWSTDLGVTWTTPENVTSMVDIAARQRIYTRAHLRGEEEWWTDPVLIMVGFVQMTSGSSQDRRNAVWVSLDRGHTFDGPTFMDDEVEDAGYGDAFANLTNGEFGFVSYQGTLNAAALNQYDFSIVTS